MSIAVDRYYVLLPYQGRIVRVDGETDVGPDGRRIFHAMERAVYWYKSLLDFQPVDESDRLAILKLLVEEMANEGRELRCNVS